MNQPVRAASSHVAHLVCVIVISITVSGYFIGLQAPMQHGKTYVHENSFAPLPSIHQTPVNDLPATRYDDLNIAELGVNKDWQIQLDQLFKTTPEEFPQEADLEIRTISQEQKQNALMQREKRRAFNGAPPTIPHAIDQMSTAACMACHQTGAATETLRIPKMSHAFYANCTQCHVEQNPTHLAAEIFQPNTFVGLAAPEGGPRAYTGAPPQIPHSTWMREDCLSCHGPTSFVGIQTTHPWRSQCQQCHTASSELEQFPFSSEPEFLPALKTLKAQVSD